MAISFLTEADAIMRDAELEAALDAFENEQDWEEPFLDIQALYARVEPILAKKRQQHTPPPEGRERILVMRWDGLGDMIRFSPFLRELRRLYPTAHIALVCGKHNVIQTEYCPYIDEIVSVPVILDSRLAMQRHGGYRVCRLLAERFSDYDIAFCSSVPYETLVAYLAGIPQRVGISYRQHLPIYCDKRDILQTTSYEVPDSFMDYTHQKLAMLEQFSGQTAKDDDTEIWMPEKDHRRGLRLIRRFRRSSGCPRVCALVPVGSQPTKCWPKEKFALLVEQLLRRDRSLSFVILGGWDAVETEKTVVSHLKRAGLGKRVLPLCDKLSFLESAAVIENSDLCIGADTALIHAAGTYRKPTLTICCFPADIPFDALSWPVLYKQYAMPNVTVQPEKALDGCNAPCLGCSHIEDAHCIRSIETDTVLRAWECLQKRISEGNCETVYIS